MKKFVITEEEKQRILNLYEKIGETLTPESSNSYKAQDTKKIATFLNQYYKLNLPSATSGNWHDQDYNDTFKKFLEEKGISVWVCKKGDGYCHDDSEGEVTTKELDKLKQAMNPKYSQFTQDFASMIGVPVDQVSWLEALNDNIDQNTKKQYFDLSKNQSKNIGFAISKIIRSNKFDEVIKQMESYSKPMSKDQKSMLDTFVDDLKSMKPVYQKKMNSMSQDEWDKFSQSNFPVDDSFSPKTPTSSSDEKINTTHDKSYDYKLSGGKYYYTTKGQNNWVEAKGTGLESIKSKVTF